MGFTEPAPPSGSSSSSSHPRFDADLLRAYMKKLLQSTLTGSAWPEEKERDRVLRAWIKEIGNRVEERMVEIQPRGLLVFLSCSLLLVEGEADVLRHSKTIVLTQVNENRNQSVGGRSVFCCCSNSAPTPSSTNPTKFQSRDDIASRRHRRRRPRNVL
jgi:tctex1 domain-containing protein 2